MTDLPQPDYARNMRIIGHCDQGGRPDGVQIMVHRGYAYIGHMFSKGFSVVDVRDAKRPRAVNYLAAPPGTWNIHLQTHDDLLLVVNAKDMFAAAEFQDERHYYKGSLGKKVGTADAKEAANRDWTAGMTVYDIANPAQPRQIGFCEAKVTRPRLTVGNELPPAPVFEITLDGLAHQLGRRAVFLVGGGYLIIEIGFGQRAEVEESIDARIWKLLFIRDDLQGIPRTVTLQKRD